MPSKQSQAVKRHWTAARLAMVQPDAEQPDDESCGDLTAEPHDMDYIEIDAGGLPAMWAAPKRRAEDRVLLCMHGGGFINGSIYSHRKLFGHLAKATGARALLFDYHLAPGHTHPTQVNEATAVYRWLLDQGVSADHIAFTGDSSGGGLSITTQLRARERGLPLPAAAMPFSPWVDMEVIGKSYETNRDREPFFYKESVRQFAGIFLDEGGDPAIRWPTRCMPTCPASDRSTSRWAGTRRCWMMPVGSPSTPAGPASTCGSTSSPTCCTPSRWPPVERPRPTRQSVGWPTGCGPGSACRSPRAARASRYE
jgi:epsilon-lactone hydrolase